MGYRVGLLAAEQEVAATAVVVTSAATQCAVGMAVGSAARPAAGRHLSSLRNWTAVDCARGTSAPGAATGAVLPPTPGTAAGTSASQSRAAPYKPVAAHGVPLSRYTGRAAPSALPGAGGRPTASSSPCPCSLALPCSAFSAPRISRGSRHHRSRRVDAGSSSWGCLVDSILGPGSPSWTKPYPARSRCGSFVSWPASTSPARLCVAVWRRHSILLGEFRGYSSRSALYSTSCLVSMWIWCRSCKRQGSSFFIQELHGLLWPSSKISVEIGVYVSLFYGLPSSC